MGGMLGHLGSTTGRRTSPIAGQANFARSKGEHCPDHQPHRPSASLKRQPRFNAAFPSASGVSQTTDCPLGTPKASSTPAQACLSVPSSSAKWAQRVCSTIYNLPTNPSCDHSRPSDWVSTTPPAYLDNTSWQYRTGAAHMTFCVKVPPTTASVSQTTSARSAFLPDARRPAYAPVWKDVRCAAAGSGSGASSGMQRVPRGVDGKARAG